MEIFNSLFTNALPLFFVILLATISVILCERAGIINLGANGVIVAGATTYMLMASLITKGAETSGSMWLEIPIYLISGIFGMLFSCLHGFAVIKLKANQVVSGIALNILATGIVFVVVIAAGHNNSINWNLPPLSIGNMTQSDKNPVAYLGSLMTIVSIILSAIVIFGMQFTKWGLRFKAIGENPQAADVAGVKVNSMKWQAILISGFLSGIAGAIFISATVSGQSIAGGFKGNVAGIGYLAIAIMIIGRWKFISSIIVSVFFSILISLGSLSTTILGMSLAESNLIQMIPYVITLIVLVMFSDVSTKWFTRFLIHVSKPKDMRKYEKLNKQIEKLEQKNILIKNAIKLLDEQNLDEEQVVKTKDFYEEKFTKNFKIIQTKKDESYAIELSLDDQNLEKRQNKIEKIEKFTEKIEKFLIRSEAPKFVGTPYDKSKR